MLPSSKDADQDLLREAARALGRRRSPKKSAAARKNGKKGGRPPGIPASEETKAKIRASQAQRRTLELTGVSAEQK